MVRHIGLVGSREAQVPSLNVGHSYFVLRSRVIMYFSNFNRYHLFRFARVCFVCFFSFSREFGVFRGGSLYPVLLRGPYFWFANGLFVPLDAFPRGHGQVNFFQYRLRRRLPRLLYAYGLLTYGKASRVPTLRSHVRNEQVRLSFFSVCTL